MAVFGPGPSTNRPIDAEVDDGDDAASDDSEILFGSTRGGTKNGDEGGGEKDNKKMKKKKKKRQALEVAAAKELLILAISQREDVDATELTYLNPEDLDDVFYTLTGISSCTARSKDHFLAAAKRAIMDTRGLEARFEIASEVASQLGWGIVDCLLCGAVAGRTKMISSTWYAAVMRRDGQFAAGGDGKTSRKCFEGMRKVGHDDHWSSAKNVQRIHTWIHEHRTCCRAPEPGSPRMSPDPKAEEDIQVRSSYIQGDGPRDMQ